MKATPGKIPVFVFPTSLSFFLTSKSSHKQLLTMYNPYEFPFKYKVLSTAPSKYTVMDPDGIIGPKTMVDIVIRHISPTPPNCGLVDRFRIYVLDQHTEQVMGRKDVDAILLDCDKESNSDDGDFHASYKSEMPSIRTNRSLSGPSSLYLLLVIATVAIVILCLPTSPDSVEAPNPSIPVYLYMSVQIKLFCAFILGMIILALIRVV